MDPSILAWAAEQGPSSVLAILVWLEVRDMRRHLAELTGDVGQLLGKPRRAAPPVVAK